MKRLLILVIPALIYAEGLKSILDFAVSNNNIVLSKKLTEQSKQKDAEASVSTRYPSISLGGFYQNLNTRTNSVPGATYNGYARASIDLYDGGYKTNAINQSNALLESSKFDTKAYMKSLQFSIVQDFYNIKNGQANIKALNDEQNQLRAELIRVNKFYEVGSATKDDIDKLQAAYSNNAYLIDEAKYELLSLKKLLSLKIGKRIKSIDNSKIIRPIGVEKDLSDDISTLKQNAKALSYYADSFSSSYRPKITLSDTFNLYGYGRYDNAHPKGLDNQNELMLTFSINLYDDGLASKQKQSVMIQKMSLEKEIAQQVKTQDINVELANSKIRTAIAQIKSAKSSLTSARSAFETVAKKYQVGSVDNVAFLDALTVRTNAQSQYQMSLNNLQIDYANYYYYTNKNIKEYIK